MKRRPLWPLLPPVIATALAFSFLSTSRWFGAQGARCAIKQWTGYYCPGCGGTRCASDLIHGHFLEALGHNALLTTGALIFLLGNLYLIIRITILGKTPPKINLSPILIWVILGTVILFAILRNLDTFSYLAP